MKNKRCQGDEKQIFGIRNVRMKEMTIFYRRVNISKNKKNRKDRG